MSNPSTDSYRNALRHMGQDYSFAPRYIRNRDPHSPTNASNDIKPKEQQGYYPTGSFWTNNTNGNLWALQKITNNLANWILLSGGSSGPLLNITVDIATGTGTNPVVPSGTGNITITGGQVATGTVGANVIRTDSVSPNEFTIEIQRSTAVASSNSADNGVAHFNSAGFTVDSNGFVSLTGGGSAITSLTGDDTLPVVPTAGNINLDGVTVANGTHAKPVFFAKNATSTEELDVQITTVSTSGSKNINNAGLASFNSTEFTVDSATGFVSLVAANPFSQINVQRVTATGAFTYTPTTNMKYVFVELIGGGGGSGGVAATTGNVAMGGGGSGGGYAKFLLTAAQVGSSLSGSIGAGGTAATAGNNFGGTGGSTTLATSSAWTVAGGAGGQGSAAVTVQAYTGQAGGTVSTGTGITIIAQTGGASGSAGGTNTIIVGGFGGNSFYGNGGPGAVNSSLNFTAVGISGTGFGAGASGPINLGTASASAGAAGTSGVAIFTEFI